MRDGNVDDQPTGRLAGLWRRLVQHPLEKLGPGLITGVADESQMRRVAGDMFGFMGQQAPKGVST